MLGTSTRRWTTIAVVAAVLIAAGWLVVRHLTQDRLSEGFVASRSLALGELTDQAEVRLPIGTLTLSTGAPLNHVSAASVGEPGGGDLEAEGGAAIVPLAWSFEPALSVTGAVTYPSSFGLSLRPSGTDTDVDLDDIDLDLTGNGDATGPFAATTLVAVVAGDGTGLDVAVTYEGLTQVADLASGEVDSGAAAPLYAGSGPLDAREDCDPTVGDDLVYLTPALPSQFLQCRVDPVVRSPYLPFLGWADDGDAWTVATVSLTSSGRVRWLRTDARYRVRRGEPRMRLDGVEPTDQTCTEPSGTQTCTATFSGPADQQPDALRVDAPLTGIKVDQRPGPDPVRFGIHQTFHLTT